MKNVGTSMNSEMPPPLPRCHRVSVKPRNKLVVGLALIAGVFVAFLFVLRIIGLLRLFSIPTGSMVSAVYRGDHVLMEGVTYLSREPHRGDIVVFKTDGIASVPPSQIYIKRIAGEPGERLRISGEQLLINEQEVVLSNAAGRIIFGLPPGMEERIPRTSCAPCAP